MLFLQNVHNVCNTNMQLPHNNGHNTVSHNLLLSTGSNLFHYFILDLLRLNELSTCL